MPYFCFVTDIEPDIRPLVDALNRTGLLRTFSSCEGHFGLSEQTFRDRNRAYVKFTPAPGISEEAVEQWLGKLLVQFKLRYGYLPIHLTGYKVYTPTDDVIEMSFTLELTPFNRFDAPEIKRADTNRAIGQVVALV